MQAMEVVRDKFPDLTEEQFSELSYEFQEWRCVILGKSRSPRWDIIRSDKVRTLLTARSEPEFAKNPYFVQFMGRGLRMPKDASDLIGKQVQIKINRKKDE